MAHLNFDMFWAWLGKFWLHRIQSSAPWAPKPRLHGLVIDSAENLREKKNLRDYIRRAGPGPGSRFSKTLGFKGFGPWSGTRAAYVIT